MRISVIVPFRDVEWCVERCILALKRQRYPHGDFELIFVDNNSTDRSSSLVAKHACVKLVQEPKPGPYAARNAGLRHATGEVLAFTDPDCEPSEGWLCAIHSTMLDQSVQLVLGRRLFSDVSTPLALLAAYEAGKIAFVVQSKKPELYYGYTNNLAVRRSVLEHIGPFAEHARGVDTMFVRRVVDELGCDAIQYDPDMEVVHLEIRSALDYYRKRTIYGESNERIKHLTRLQLLGIRDRTGILLHVARRTPNPFLSALHLCALLAPSAVCYNYGRSRARLSNLWTT